MTGAQPRRTLEARVSSSVIRRTYAAPGVPGVWRVPKSQPRRRREPELTIAGWIQGPDFEVTYEVDRIDSWGYSVVVPTATSDTDIAQLLKDGDSLASAPHTPGGMDDPGMGVLFEAPEGATRTTIVQSGAAQVSGGALGDLTNAIGGGFYSHPTPDSGYELEYEHVAGTAIGDLALAGSARVVSGDSFAAGGQMRWTLEDNNTFRSVAHMMLNYEQLGTWPEQATTPFEFTVPVVDVFGGDRETQAARNMRLHVITDAVAEPGSGGQTSLPDTGPDHEARVMPDVPFTFTVTVRPPRYRFVPTAVGDWTPSPAWGAFVWDAGLFLGTDWTDVTGLPTSTPTGCEQLNFYVAPATSDMVANDGAEPFGRFYRNSDTSSGEIIAPDPGTPPAAGSHIWVLWFGPLANPSTDPVPSVSPASLIPASLAENGTG